MKNILIFRAGKHPIVKECIKSIREIEKDSCIWLCIQEECIDFYKDELVNMIVFPNGFFDYNATKNDVKLVQQLKKIRFDSVYCPHSGEIPHCSEIEKIVRDILKEKYIIYYNIYGNFNRHRLYRWRFALKKIIVKAIEKIADVIEYFLLRIIYIVVSNGR